MFPKALEDKLMAMTKTLDRFMVETEFVYKIADLDPAQAADPAADVSGWAPLSDRNLKRDQGITWVRATFTVPERCMDVPVAGSQLRVNSDNGFPVFAPVQVYIDGRLALEERAWMDFKCPEGIVTESAEPGRRHTVAFRMDFNEKCYWLNRFSLQIISDRVEDCANHIRSIIEELKYMERYEGTAQLIERACALLDEAAGTGSVASVRAAEAEARALFEGYRVRVKRNRVHLVGHAHIDMNWFWSMAETRDIVERDFTTMTNLCERYPDFKFSQSQCATYEIAEARCPEVFQKMQALERANRWDVTASTWVEGDLNMAQGESIVRHVLYSKAHLKDRFTKQPRIMWCPDTFGHPGTVPQILKKSGIDHYYHTRCGLGVGSHDDSAGFDYLEDSRHTPVYWWKGLDGSRVLVCNTVYNRTLNTRGLLRASARMNEFGLDRAMLTYGVGDHGGGPTVRDIEWVNTVRAFPTVPDLYFSTTEEYYAEVERGDYALPERCGEMNFVFDGCYTTHADVKRENRLCEERLMALEKLYAIAGEFGVAYPHEALRDLWKRTLFNQFHDILDGSGVKDTYVFTMEEAGFVLSSAQALTDAAMAELGKQFGAERGEPFLAYNPTGFARGETIGIQVAPGKTYSAHGPTGREYPCQTDDGIARVFVDDLPPSGLKVLTLTESPCAAAGHVVEGDKHYRIDTPMYEIELCKANGQITTLYDKANDWYVVRREVIGWRLKKGVLNSLQVHMEEPTEMSGWTIGNVRTIHNLLSGAKSSVVYDGPVECRIRFEHRFGASAIRQDIIISQVKPEILFETNVDWQEWGDFERDAPMLRACFSPAVLNSEATYEIPFGTIARHADDNEYPALNWVDISDGSHGFAVLNDCKHGHKCRGNAMELTLIRSGWLPDQKSDVGQHAFTYAILPHAGNWADAHIIAAGQALNQPVTVARAGAGGAAECSLIACEGAVLSNVKKAESGEGIVARIYNPSGAPAGVRVALGFDATAAKETDLLEQQDLGALKLDAGRIEFDMTGYEIKTLLIR